MFRPDADGRMETVNTCILRAWCAIGVVGSLAAGAGAAVVNISAVKDNTLFNETTPLSNGAGDYLFAGATANPNLRRALLKFDIAGSVPAGATITGVTFRMHMSKSVSTTNDMTTVHRVLADWGEGTSNAPGEEGGGTAPSVGDATWNFRFFNTTAWTNLGGDFAGGASASLAVAPAVGFYSWTGAGLVADVQAWLGSPATNFGWLVKGDEATIASARRYDSRTNPTAENRPVLIVEYTPVPAPAGAAAVLAGLGIGARRRRA